MDLDRFFDRQLKLHHLRLLVLFANTGQIRKVAERLNVSQPAVSKQLADLESALGTPIVQRVGNRLIFTAAGHVLHKRAREVLLELENAKQDLLELADGLRGNLNIGGVATVLRNVAPKLILGMKERAPAVGVSLLEATSDVLFPLLASGDLDIVLSRTVPPQIAIGDFACKPLPPDPIVIVCGKQHPLARTAANALPENLSGWPWVFPPKGSPSFMALNNWMHENELSIPDGCVESICLPINSSLIEMHPYLGLMPESLLRQSANLVRVCAPRAAFLEATWLFFNRTPSQPLVFAAMELLEEISPYQ